MEMVLYRSCEPEPILNKGWFTNASSRAMMVHSRWFDKIQPEDENINGREAGALVLNQLRRYADVKEITIRVKKAGRNACSRCQDRTGGI